jgi:phage terminase Nu1 subunit (DNA packaging protein)
MVYRGKKAAQNAPTTDADWRVPRDVIKKLLDLPHPEQVSMYAARGVLPKADAEGYPLIACVQAYIRYLRRRLDNSANALSRERAVLAREQARLAQLDRRQKEGDLVPLPYIRDLLANLAAAIRDEAEAAPARAVPRFADELGVDGQRLELLLRQFVDDLRTRFAHVFDKVSTNFDQAHASLVYGDDFLEDEEEDEQQEEAADA